MSRSIRPIPEGYPRRRVNNAGVDYQAVDFTGVREGDRFALWDEFLSRNISPHARHPVESGPFDGSMKKTSIGFLNKFTLKSSPYTSSVTNEVISSRMHHEAYILIIPHASNYRIRQDGFSIDLADGEMALLDSRLTGSISGLGYSAKTMFAMARRDWEDHAPPPNLDGDFKIDTRRSVIRLARAFLAELDAEGATSDAAEISLLSKQLLELISVYFETGSDAVPDTINKQVRLRRIKSFVRRSIGDPDLGPAAVAQHFGISPRYIGRLFQDVNSTLMDYIWDMRLQQAAVALDRPNRGPMSVKDLGFSLGFRSQSHFSTRFSARFGCSPSEYRRLSIIRRTASD